MQDEHAPLTAKLATPQAIAKSGTQSTSMSGVPSADMKFPSLLRYRQTWRVLGWWTVAYGVSSWIAEYLFSQLDPSGPIALLAGLNRVVYAVVWTGAIVIAIATTELLTITSPRQFGRIVLHFGICIIVTVLWGVLAYYICLAVVPGWQPLGVPRMLATTAKNVLFGYGLVVVLVHIILRVRLHRHQEVVLLRQAHQAAEAQLQLLKLEMQPHFLFNALHSISSLIHTNPSAANDTLVLVSDMLRRAVETTRVQEVTLGEELETLRLYTQIQEVRFGERLKLTWEIQDETLDAAIPHMLLQPLVENAIKHGLEAYANAGRIAIATLREDNDLVISIRDDGPGHRFPSPHAGAGKGIANVRSRLSQLYGERQSFTIGDAQGGGTLVTIRMPFVAGERAPMETTEPSNPKEASVVEATSQHR
jgi:two-component system, LytTR family, sensor kinase